jgi:transposase
MAIIGKNEKMNIYKGKTSDKGRRSLYQLLEKGDKVALEAGNLAFIMSREIQERVGCDVRVLNSAKLPFIWQAPTKTDKEDAMKLAHLVEERRDEKLPIVPLPSQKELERRKTVAAYKREMKWRTSYLNQLHAMFVHQGHTTVVRKNIATVENRQETVKLLTGQEREEAEWILKYLELHEQRISELKKKIKKEAQNDEDMKNLQTIPGVGPIVAYAFVAHVGDGSRFSKGAQVSNYIGFVPRLDYSGTTQRQGHITKHGNGYLRGLLVQAAWSMVRCKKESSLRDRYICLTVFEGKGKKKTIVSIGRRLTELMYSVLRDKNGFEARIWAGRREYLARLKELKNCA